jgi:hypothetical protein
MVVSLITTLTVFHSNFSRNLISNAVFSCFPLNTFQTFHVHCLDFSFASLCNGPCFDIEYQYQFKQSGTKLQVATKVKKAAHIHPTICRLLTLFREIIISVVCWFRWSESVCIRTSQLSLPSTRCSAKGMSDVGIHGKLLDSSISPSKT